jgi:hypothetical protein
VTKITTAVTVDEYGRRPMIVLGLLLVLLAVGATAVAVTAPTATPQVVNMTAVGVTVSPSPLAMFLAGAVSVLLLGLGLALISQAHAARREHERRCVGCARTRPAHPKCPPKRESSNRRDGLRDGNGTDTTKNGGNDEARSCRPNRTQTRTQTALLRPD